MLNSALATELICVLRDQRHFYTETELQNTAAKSEFLQHTLEEQGHADLLAKRIMQLNGKTDFNPTTLTDRSHPEYDDSASVHDMIRSNLIAERVAIEAYRQMIKQIEATHPTTSNLLIAITAKEEEHADDMRDLLVRRLPTSMTRNCIAAQAGSRRIFQERFTITSQSGQGTTV